MPVENVHKRREVLVALAMAMLLVAAFFALNARVDDSVATTVGNSSIAPTCDAPGVSNDSASSGGGDGNGETTAAQEGSSSAVAGGQYCQP